MHDDEETPASWPDCSIEDDLRADRRDRAELNRAEWEAFDFYGEGERYARGGGDE